MSDRDVPADVLREYYLQLFEEDRRGVAVFDDLTRRFVRPASTDGGIDAVLKTYKSLGAREVLDHIVLQINRARGVQTGGTFEVSE